MGKLFADLKATVIALLMAGLFSAILGFIGISKIVALVSAVIVFSVFYLKLVGSHKSFKKKSLGYGFCSDRLSCAAAFPDINKKEKVSSPKTSSVGTSEDKPNKPVHVSQTKPQRVPELV